MILIQLPLGFIVVALTAGSLCLLGSLFVYRQYYHPETFFKWFIHSADLEDRFNGLMWGLLTLGCVFVIGLFCWAVGAVFVN